MIGRDSCTTVFDNTFALSAIFHFSSGQLFEYQAISVSSAETCSSLPSCNPMPALIACETTHILSIGDPKLQDSTSSLASSVCFPREGAGKSSTRSLANNIARRAFAQLGLGPTSYPSTLQIMYLFHITL